jgi:hypothetical protein
VKMGMTPANHSGAAILFLLGVSLLLVALASANESVGKAFMSLLGGAVLAGIGVKLWRQAGHDYHLVISSSSGEVQAYTSKDRQRIGKMVDGVNEAIVRYR